MGQVCCRPTATIDDSIHDAKNKHLPFIIAHSETNGATHQTSTDLSDGEESWWDAESIGSMQSALSTLDLEDALEQWHEELHVDLEDSLGKDILLAARTSGGHLIPKYIEDEACCISEPTTPSIIPPLDLTGLRRLASPSKPSIKVSSHSWKDHLQHKANEPKALLLIDEAKFLHSQGRILDTHKKLLDLCLLLFPRNSSLANCTHGSSNTINIKNTDLGDADDETADVPASPTLYSYNTEYHKGKLSRLAVHSEELGIDVMAVERDACDVLEGLRNIDEEDGYMVSRNDTLKVLYRHAKQGTSHSLKFHVVLPHPVPHILAIAHEWDLIPTWNRFNVAAIKLAEPSIFESYVYGAQWMMKPFKNMQSVIHARGFDIAETHRSLLILINDGDIDNLPEGHTPLPKEYAQRKRVNFLPGSCILLKPLPVDTSQESDSGLLRTEAKFVVHIDPHIRFVPKVLVHFVLGILAPYIYSQIVRVLDSAFADESAYVKRIKEQPELYGLLDKRMADFAEELNVVEK